MASVTFKTTDGVKRTIGWSYIFGYDTGRVAQAISKIDAMLQTLEKSKSTLSGMASSGGADSIRDHYLNYVYVGEYEDLLKGYIEKIDEAIGETMMMVTGFEGRKSPCVKKLLQIMRAGQEYSSKEIADKLGLKSRVAVKRNYLEPALKGGYIEMLLPQKPHSPNQRYHKTSKKED